MARTKAEVRAFLDSQVGKIAPHPGYPSLNGQCVTLTKALMEFLGVPNPYAARGDAINAGDTYIRQGLGTAGKGWLTIVVNRDMGYIGGIHYGHIWIDLQGEANYEANGARALYTTKNTRPIAQGQQFINFDKWITEDTMSKVDRGGLETIWKGFLDRPVTAEDYKNFVGKDWADVLHTAISSDEYKKRYAGLVKLVTVEAPALRQQVKDLHSQVAELLARPTDGQYKLLEATNAELLQKNKELTAQLALQSEDTKQLNALGSALQWFIVRLGLSKKEQ